MPAVMRRATCERLLHSSRRSCRAASIADGEWESRGGSQSRPEGGEALLDTDDGRGRLVISVNLLGRAVATEVDEADIACA
ncbi:MAG TPA: hypothetical protein VNI78_13070 [Vicinamibacterales bacterium]|nr:hypothetical protein [Vicinamibacterales bacterium]